MIDSIKSVFRVRCAIRLRSKTALFRHKKADIPSALLQANQIEDHVRADTLLDRLKELNLETQFILSEAQESGDPDIALKSIARLEKQTAEQLGGHVEPQSARSAGSWRSVATTSMTISYRKADQGGSGIVSETVLPTRTDCYFGGERFGFLCPTCVRRTA